NNQEFLIKYNLVIRGNTLRLTGKGNFGRIFEYDVLTPAEANEVRMMGVNLEEVEMLRAEYRELEPQDKVDVLAKARGTNLLTANEALAVALESKDSSVYLENIDLEQLPLDKQISLSSIGYEKATQSLNKIINDAQNTPEDRQKIDTIVST